MPVQPVMQPVMRGLFLLFQNESGLPVVDRVGFACMYLNDVKLADYINKLTTSLASEGNLDGILLTGIRIYRICLNIKPPVMY